MCWSVEDYDMMTLTAEEHFPVYLTKTVISIASLRFGGSFELYKIISILKFNDELLPIFPH
jgi:hypothetical protein